MSDDLLNLTLVSDQRHISSVQDHDINIAIELDAHPSLKGVAKARAAAPHLCLVLDCSGSMHARDASGETYLAQMVRSASKVADYVQASDLISVVFFSTSVSEPIQVSGDQPQRLRQAIEQAHEHPYGQTNMKGGLEAALEALKPSKKRPKHILLFTDGGPTGSKRAVVELAGQASAQGVSVSVCGFNDQLSLPYLSEIASAGNGSTLRSVNEQQLQIHFSQFTRDAQMTAVTDLTLELELHPALLARHVLRGMPQQQYLRACKASERSIRLPLGAVKGGSWQLLVLSARVMGSQVQAGEALMKARVSYVVPSVSAQVCFTPQLELTLPVKGSPASLDRRLNDNLKPTLIKAEVYRFERLKHKDHPEESLKLAREIIRAYESLETPEGDELAAAFKTELSGLFAGEALSSGALNALSDASTSVTRGSRLSELLSHSSSTTWSSTNSETNQGASRVGGQRASSPRNVIKFDI